MTQHPHQEFVAMAREMITADGCEAVYVAVAEVRDADGNIVCDDNGDPVQEKTEYPIMVLCESTPLLATESAVMGSSLGVLHRGGMKFILSGDALPVHPDTMGYMVVDGKTYKITNAIAQKPGPVICMWEIFADAVFWPEQRQV